MPGPGTILEGLRSIANDGIVVAGVWHLCLAAACVALLFGWRPSQRAAATGMAAPVASVAVAAFRYDNPFNGIVFAALAAGMLGLAARLERRPVTVRGTASTIVGAVMIAFGWLYPHFLEQRSPALYLVAAPMGLIPCPTLSLIIGLTFLAGGFGSRAWMFVLAAAGLFYGVFGAARLGVRIDLVLAAGALSLIILGLRHGLVAALRRRSPAPG